ncbi:MAG TPA: DUF4926 domain-containing protein [Ktedonobacterales bacterium]|jgi:Domain of unknown function (DUF4926)|nr:DUF4926 domain-containing protein [Ktedonobacterales bacterium]
MIDELSTVVLTTDLPQYGLRAGDLGTVVLVHQGGDGYTVEFTTLSGDTIAVATLPADHVRPTRPNDMAHVRELAATS